MRKVHIWSPEQVATLRAEYATASPRELAARYGRSEDSLRNKASELGLHRDVRHCRRRSGSRMTEALKRLRDVDAMSPREFARLLIDIAGDKEKAQDLRKEMRKQGFLAHFVTITEPARRAIKELA